MYITQQIVHNTVTVDEPDTIIEQKDTDTSFSAQTSNATLFYSWEAPDGYRLAGRRESFRQLFKRLWGYQTGLYNGWWEDAKKHNLLRKHQLLEMFTCYLEMTPRQKSQAEYFLSTQVTDMRKFRVSNINPTETTLIALCAYVCHENGRQCHPNHREFDDLFEELKETVGVRHEDFTSAYGKLEQMLSRDSTQRDIPTDEYIPPPQAGRKWPSKRGI